MTDQDDAPGGRTGDRAGEGSGGAASGGRPSSVSGEGNGYEGSGAWGTWALVLLGILFVIATAATVHSVLVTFGG